MAQGNKQEVNIILKEFKQPDGNVYYPALFAIPSDYRLTTMAAKDYRKVAGIVTVGLTNAFESMNLSRPMKAAQIMDLTDTVLESAGEDNLSLEDLMLFMQKLTRGEYGSMYESMDIPKFMEKFEIYREERFKAITNIRDEQAAQHKTAKVDDRLADMFGNGEKELNREAMKQYLQTKKPE